MAVKASRGADTSQCVCKLFFGLVHAGRVCRSHFLFGELIGVLSGAPA